MPRGDGTGPLGQGKMTGRGFGNCIAYGIPALIGAVAAFGFGRRGGRFGRGFGGGRSFAGTPSKEAELSVLKEEARSIQERISEIEKN